VVLYQQQRRAAEALAILRELAELEPRNPAHQVAQGMFYLQMRSFEKAVASFERAIALDPKVDAAYAGLAQAYLQKRENLEEARRLAETAVRLSPRPDYFIVLAVACAEVGDLEEARRNVEKALAMDPSHDLAQKLARFLQHGI
jgi:tetratricopeptide (TPR) repeat protein